MSEFKRLGKDEYFVMMAGCAAKRSTCLKRQYGAIIVKNDRIISTGYNGSPKGCVNCCDTGCCPRMNIPNNTDYSTCNSIHAEQNAIIQASLNDMQDSTLYLYGYQNGVSIESPDCCNMCKRFIINAGIKKVVFGNEHGVIRTQMVFDWISELDENARRNINQYNQNKSQEFMDQTLSFFESFNEQLGYGNESDTGLFSTQPDGMSVPYPGDTQDIGIVTPNTNVTIDDAFNTAGIRYNTNGSPRLTQLFDNNNNNNNNNTIDNAEAAKRFMHDFTCYDDDALNNFEKDNTIMHKLYDDFISTKHHLLYSNEFKKLYCLYFYIRNMEIRYMFTDIKDESQIKSNIKARLLHYIDWMAPEFNYVNTGISCKEIKQMDFEAKLIYSMLIQCCMDIPNFLERINVVRNINEVEKKVNEHVQKYREKWFNNVINGDGKNGGTMETNNVDSGHTN